MALFLRLWDLYLKGEIPLASSEIIKGFRQKKKKNYIF